MAEPTTPTATLTVAALGGAVGLPASLAMGDYGVVLLSALAAALVQVSAKEQTSVKAALMTMTRIIVVALALSAAFAWIVMSLWPSGNIPVHVALALTSFFIGLADGNWKAIGYAVGNWALNLLPSRPGSKN